MTSSCPKLCVIAPHTESMNTEGLLLKRHRTAITPSDNKPPPRLSAPAIAPRVSNTKKNLEMRVEAENGATAGKMDLAKKAKELGLDAIHDTVHEMARDEARHGKAFAGLLARYFK